jgi:type II secretion system protein N
MSASDSAAAGREDALSSSKSPFKMASLGLFFVFLIILFGLFKLPEARVTTLVQSYIQSALDPYGIYMTDRGRSLSLLKGFKYNLDHPSLELPDLTRVDLDELEVHPLFSALLSGKLGARASLKQGNSELVAEGRGRGGKMDADLSIADVDLGKFGVFSFLGIKGAGGITGKIHLDGNLSSLDTLNGNIDLRLRNLRLDEQTLYGFRLPTILVSDGTLNIEVRNGKLIFKDVRIGKSNDDITLNATGDLTLNRFLNSSQLNMRVVFGTSQKLKASLSFLDSMLASSKQKDGQFAYKLTGTLSNPFPSPDPSK